MHTMIIMKGLTDGIEAFGLASVKSVQIWTRITKIFYCQSFLLYSIQELSIKQGV